MIYTHIHTHTFFFQEFGELQFEEFNSLLKQPKNIQGSMGREGGREGERRGGERGGKREREGKGEKERGGREGGGEEACLCKCTLYYYTRMHIITILFYAS